jgi:hypothetical protein
MDIVWLFYPYTDHVRHLRIYSAQGITLNINEDEILLGVLQREVGQSIACRTKEITMFPCNVSARELHGVDCVEKRIDNPSMVFLRAGDDTQNEWVRHTYI